jgi:hypothetical protein
MVAVPKKLREPVTIVLLAVMVLRLVLAVVELVRSIQHLDRDGPSGLLSGDSGSGGSAAAVLFFSSTDALNVVVLALLVGACVLWSPTPRARQLSLAALLVTSAVVVVSAIDVVVLVLAGPGAAGWWEAALAALLALALPVLALVALAQLRRALRSADTEPGEISAGPAQADTPALEAGSEPGVDPDHQPVWQPDQAAGAAWLTAGEAASGAAASRWGTPGDSGGWQPQPSGASPGATPGPVGPPARSPGSPTEPAGPAATAGPVGPGGSRGPVGPAGARRSD